MNNYNINTNNIIEDHLIEIQSIKSKLIRNGILLKDHFDELLPKLIPNFDKNNISYLNSDLIISFYNWKRDDIISLFKNTIFPSIIVSIPKGLLTEKELELLTTNSTFFISIQQIHPNIYIIRI